MAIDKNHLAHGKDSVRDNDLLDMVPLCATLPWLEQVLMEVQYLRNRGDDAVDERIEYLEDVLDRLGVDYDGS